MIPGGNILGMALKVIARQAFMYFRFIGRETNTIGTDVSNYAPGIPVSGSMQPVPRNLYAEMGLDLQSSYWNIFIERGIVDVTRETAGDQFKYGGKTFQTISVTPWCVVDGWDQVLVIEVPSSAGVQSA